jgi:hypothetical protein
MNMAPLFHTVPDWTSWENQGANVAVGDLDGDGQPELIVLRVDHPSPGPNRAFYRVGKRVDPQGNVLGGWDPWIEVPGWEAMQNSGAGIAVATFGANHHLVVFQIEHIVPGPNRGRFRLGRHLDPRGNVTAGWSDWQDVPDWRSWRDQGAAIAVADLDADGRPDLIVFHVDDFHGNNPERPNKGFYRVGRRLGEDGSIAQWGPWQEVDWFSWFNQGAGIALTDLDGDQSPELVVFNIDNPPHENAGWYRVGWALDANGRATGGWGPWSKVTGWGSLEDQGGGLALVSFGAARPKAVVFHVDAPPGLNEGRFAVVDLVLDIDQAKQQGVWRLLPYLSDIMPVHAALLHTGKLLFFAGSGNNLARADAPGFGEAAKGLYTSVLWDPIANSFKDLDALRRVGNNRPIDFFCGGHCFLSDGRLIVVGGTDQYDVVFRNGQMVGAGHGFTGTKDALIFDPATEHWTAAASMQHGRWYPTATMLGDGRIVVFSGIDETGSGTTGAVEVLQASGAGHWQQVREFNLPLYPHLFLTATGRLFYSGGKMDTEGNSNPLLFDPLAPSGAALIQGLADADRCNQSASVILPPAQEQRFMILGGGAADEGQGARRPATRRVSVIDLSHPGSRYERKADLIHERMHVNAVLLPDRTVLAAGGGVTREASTQPRQVQPGTVLPTGVNEVFEGEIYNPAINTWTRTAPATVARLYHSVALLLPDGRVVTASGNPDKGIQANWLPPDPREEMRLEIFSPPYLFAFDAANPRPEITAAPDQIRHGQVVTIGAPRTSQIKWVNLISPGLTTHSFNITQRVVDAPILARRANQIDVRIPGEANVSPPGWYMIFLTDDRGIPSIARWTQLS